MHVFNILTYDFTLKNQGVNYSCRGRALKIKKMSSNKMYADYYDMR